MNFYKKTDTEKKLKSTRASLFFGESGLFLFLWRKGTVSFLARAAPIRDWNLENLICRVETRLSCETRHSLSGEVHLQTPECKERDAHENGSRYHRQFIYNITKTLLYWYLVLIHAARYNIYDHSRSLLPYLLADERRCFRRRRRLPPGRWRLRLQLYSLHLRPHLRGVCLFGARRPLRIAVLAPIAAEELPLVAVGGVGVTR